MRLGCLFLFATSLLAQPEYSSLEKAYAALRAKDYDAAIAAFEEAARLAPQRVDVRKDLAYTLLKTGESEAAREQFSQAMLLDPADQSVALEFAFLSYESRTDPIPSKALARRTFDRIRKTGNATAEQAFENIDRPLAEGIARWLKALEIGPESFSAHYELAQLAEQRGQLDLAAEHYRAAWKMGYERKYVLLDIARVDPALTIPALLAASRGGEPRAADLAREQLPSRYPYVYEFRAALALDPANLALHRELAYLLVAMHDPTAVQEFRNIVAAHPEDQESSTQLGLLLGRQDRIAPVSAKEMGMRSFNAGYLNDALRYLNIAHETDPSDGEVTLKLAWTYNLLHDDRAALDWFDLARHSTNPEIAQEAARAYNNLKPSIELFRTTVWAMPFYSSRWNDGFGYGQVKTDLNLHTFFRPYVSARLISDTKPDTNNQPLSERSVIAAVGVSAQWNGLTAWGEAGSAISYVKGSMTPDYRGGLSWARAWTGRNHTFLEANADEVFISRFGKDWLTYLQTRAGYRWLLWNTNFTADANRQHWANFIETGPGLRFRLPHMPKGLVATIGFYRGVYLINDGSAHHANFNDLRAGVWYAYTH